MDELSFNYGVYDKVKIAAIAFTRNHKPYLPNFSEWQNPNLHHTSQFQDGISYNSLVTEVESVEDW